MHQTWKNIDTSKALEDRARLLLQEIFGDRAVGGAYWNGEKFEGKKVVFFDTPYGTQRCIWRFRRGEKFSRDVFTVRSMQRGHRDCELWKILKGEFDHYLYLCIDEETKICDWFLIHLSPFRRAINSDPARYINEFDEIDNYDGTAYFKFNVKDFPAGTITRAFDAERAYLQMKHSAIYEGTMKNFDQFEDRP